ncbi:MAG: hypothetical protein R2835_03525 [Thermomicrobiales bacterium]
MLHIRGNENSAQFEITRNDIVGPFQLEPEGSVWVESIANGKTSRDRERLKPIHRDVRPKENRAIESAIRGRLPNAVGTTAAAGLGCGKDSDALGNTHDFETADDIHGRCDVAHADHRPTKKTPGFGCVAAGERRLSVHHNVIEVRRSAIGATVARSS